MAQNLIIMNTHLKDADNILAQKKKKKKKKKMLMFLSPQNIKNNR